MNMICIGGKVIGPCPGVRTGQHVRGVLLHRGRAAQAPAGQGGGAGERLRRVSPWKRRCGPGRERWNLAIKDNSLSIVLFVLLFSVFAHLPSLRRLAAPKTITSCRCTVEWLVGYWSFLSSGAFLEGLASNWQGRGCCWRSRSRPQRPLKIPASRAPVPAEPRSVGNRGPLQGTAGPS